MRCMSCGEGMALTAVMPDDAITATGFEQQIFTCLGCHAAERRLVYTRRRDRVSAPASSAGHQPAPADASPAPAGPRATPGTAEAMPDPAGSGSQQPNPAAQALTKTVTSAAAWARAVEKLRSRQAELMQRAPWPEREHWTVQFTKDWERLAPARRHPSDTSASERQSGFSPSSARALRARLRKLTSAAERAHTQLPANGSSDEAVQKFNRVWESLVQSSSDRRAEAEQTPQAAKPEPLPRSLSLVSAESLQGAHGQAILMLRSIEP